LETACPLLHVLKDYPKEVLLRDGSGVTLRPIAEDDGPLLIRMLEGLSEEDRWFLGLGERVEAFVDRFMDSLKSDRVFAVAALLEGDMIAAAVLVRNRPGAEGHAGRILMSVSAPYRERRLGTWMLLDLINAAMAMGLDCVRMNLVEGRDALIMRGVEKIQFVKEAVLRGFARDMDGCSRDLAVMVKRLPRGWTEEGLC